MAVGYIKRLAGPFSGAGTKTLPFGFKIFAPTDVYVALAAAESEPPATLVYGSDYTVTMNEEQDVTPGGTVELTTPLTDEQRVSVGTNIPYTQETQLTNHNRFPPEIVNTGLDRIVIQIQQIVEMLGRAVIVEPTDTKTPLEMRYELLQATASALDAAAKALQSETNAASSAATSKEYADKLLAFKDQIVTVSDNIKSVGIMADNAEAIAEIAKNLEELLKSKDYAAEAKGWAEKANAITGEQALIMPGGTSPLPVLDWIAAKPHVFKSVADMRAARFLAPGMTAVTQGYWTPNDGGTAAYVIREKTDGDKDDAGAIHFLQGDLVAELIVERVVSVKWFGAKGDGVTDDAAAIQAALDSGLLSTRYWATAHWSAMTRDLVFPKGTYKISAGLATSLTELNIDFSGSRIVYDGDDYLFTDSVLNRGRFINGHYAAKNVFSLANNNNDGAFVIIEYSYFNGCDIAIKCQTQSSKVFVRNNMFDVVKYPFIVSSDFAVFEDNWIYCPYPDADNGNIQVLSGLLNFHRNSCIPYYTEGQEEPDEVAWIDMRGRALIAEDNRFSGEAHFRTPVNWKHKFDIANTQPSIGIIRKNHCSGNLRYGVVRCSRIPNSLVVRDNYQIVLQTYLISLSVTHKQDFEADLAELQQLYKKGGFKSTKMRHFWYDVFDGNLQTLAQLPTTSGGSFDFRQVEEQERWNFILRNYISYGDLLNKRQKYCLNFSLTSPFVDLQEGQDISFLQNEYSSGERVIKLPIFIRSSPLKITLNWNPNVKGAVYRYSQTFIVNKYAYYDGSQIQYRIQANTIVKVVPNESDTVSLGWWNTSSGEQNFTGVIPVADNTDWVALCLKIPGISVSVYTISVEPA